MDNETPNFFQKYGSWILPLSLAIVTIIGNSFMMYATVDGNSQSIIKIEEKVDVNTGEYIKATSERGSIQMFLKDMRNYIEKRMDRIEAKLDRIKPSNG